MDSLVSQGSWTNVARHAYGAYVFSVGGVDDAGKELPDWDSLGERRQVGWLAAVTQADMSLTILRTGNYGKRDT